MLLRRWITCRTFTFETQMKTVHSSGHRPESYDGTLFADVTLGLVLGGLGGGHAVQDG